MEALLDQADALILAAGEDGPERPSFEIPESLLPLTVPNEDWLEIRENPNKGKGWFAKGPIPAGSVILVSKPIAMALDLEYVGPDQEEDDEEQNEDGVSNHAMEESENPEEPQESTVNELLVLEILQSILTNPSIWLQQISKLYPREHVDIEASPVWISKDDEVFSQFETMVEQIEQVPELKGKSKEISQRLPLIIRYNVLSVETCPELLSHPGLNGHNPLSGVGLYHWPSFFNHDARPNVSRYAVGDIMWFVTNQDIHAGQELCISYLEHDVLCESPHRRNLMLTLDFKEDEDANHALHGTRGDDDGPDAPVVDSDVQNELMSMNPFERLEAIDQLMQQAAGEALPEGERLPEEEDGMDAEGNAWFQCDLQNLRILKAITLEGMGLSEKALPIWNECVQFTETKMPPNDETSIVVRVQAALCSLNLKDENLARQHAAIALQRHNLIFGGGVRRFRRRYRQEFCLNLRPDAGDFSGQPMEDFLWPYGNE
mmetsp:Transcript_13147/g.24675  ORF Transcript_13147/g.24675 Transcript_13147/m.24675 type:complete len:489 (-) Transcript_13147:237-1703(-)